MSEGREDYDRALDTARDALLGSLADLHNAALRCRYEGLHAMPEEGVRALPDEEGMVRLHDAINGARDAVANAYQAWRVAAHAGQSWSVVRNRPYWDPVLRMTEETTR